MTAPIPFSPLSRVSAAENVAAFIARARHELTAFGDDLDFDSNCWDITVYYATLGYRDSRQGKTQLLFTHRIKDGGHPLSDKIRDFAKAYIRSELSSVSASDMERAITCFRALDEAMAALDVEALWDCDAAAFNKAVEILCGRLKPKSVDSTGPKLGIIARFLDENGLARYPLDSWKYIRREPQTHGRIGEEFEQRRREKLPDPEALDALAQAFCLAKDPRDVLVTSASAILCSAPERINEVLFLSENCEVEQQGENGKPYLGLRWTGSKGYSDHIKLVLPGMADVVRSAIGKIRGLTEEARRIALWYEQHPSQLYLPDHLTHLRGHELLHLEAIAQLIGLGANRNNVRRWIDENRLPTTTTRRPSSRRPVVVVRFEDFERHIIGLLPVGFPVCDAKTGLKYSESLFIMPRGLFSSSNPSLCMFEPLDYHHIGCALGQNAGAGSVTVFQRVGLDPDRRLFIKSHQFRHYLNTLAQGANLSQVDIAKWSGRANIAQNAAYDHVSSQEIVARIRAAVGDHAKAIGALAEIPKNLPVSRDDFAKMAVPTAHATLYGFCIHDFSTLPCEMFRKCLDCREHVCIKGVPGKLERVAKALEMARLSLDRAHAALADETFGADDWVATHQSTVERLEQLMSILTNPDIPDGAVIQLSASGTYSLSEAAMADYMRLSGPLPPIPVASPVRLIRNTTKETPR